MLEISMTNNAEGASEDLAADLAAVRKEVARLADTLSKLVQHQTTDCVRAVRSEIEPSIGRKPLTAVLIAFGIGISLGMRMRSRG
jgi:hypothetical protein